jgi:XTP/dITP diphosphohydrolase
MAKILIASNNPGKRVEIQALLTPESGLADIELLLPHQIGLVLDVVEDGKTYADNAALKALAYYRAIVERRSEPLIILADDSGLEVDRLEGAPGVYSARYAPISGADQPKPVLTDADRCAYLLQNLAGKPQPWLAHFHCTVALVSPQGELAFAEGDCPGMIISQARGSGGFGYYPIFILPEWVRTILQLTM